MRSSRKLLGVLIVLVCIVLLAMPVFGGISFNDFGGCFVLLGILVGGSLIVVG